MSYGLQVRDGAGNVILTITDRLTRFIAQYSVSVSASSTTNVSIPDITADGTWFVYYLDRSASCSINNGSVSCFNTSTTTAITFNLLVFRC
jgi:hypothetical protein